MYSGTWLRGATTAVLLGGKLHKNKPVFKVIGLEKSHEGLNRVNSFKEYKFPLIVVIKIFSNH